MLTVVQIRALKPTSKPYKVADVDGLFLLVQPSGALLWRFRFRAHGFEKKLSLSFPDVSLHEARRLRDKARAKLIDGIDPLEEKMQRKLEAEVAARTTFKLVAEEYIQKMEREGKSPATIKKARWFLDLPDRDRVRAAYHRGAHWAERVRMAQWWSDHLDELKVGGKVVKMRSRRRA